MTSNKLDPSLVAILVNREHSRLSNQIKAQSPVANSLVFGYCNGNCRYIPTESAVGEGGYGAVTSVAWVPVGTGEKIAAQAAADLKELGAK